MPKFIVVVECAIESENKFLFIQRPKGVHAEGLLSFPGGKFEMADGHEERDVLINAVKREVHEEVGLDLAGPIQYVTSSCFIDSKNEANIVVDVIFYAKMDEIPEKLNVSNREVASYHWLSIEECKAAGNCPPWLIKYLDSITQYTSDF